MQYLSSRWINVFIFSQVLYLVNSIDNMHKKINELLELYNSFIYIPTEIFSYKIFV